jgi:hypothetical protein
LIISKPGSGDEPVVALGRADNGPPLPPGAGSEMRGVQDGVSRKVKGTAKQAMNPVGQAGERNKIMRINKSGVQTPATVNSMREVGTQLGGGHQIEFELTIHPEGGEDYRASVSQSLHEATLQGVAEGASIIVKVDPDEPQSLLVWGAAS